MEKEYHFNVNGFDVKAVFDKEKYLPLITRWKDMQREKNGRLVVFLSAPPGAGKSTLSLFLEHLSQGGIQAVGLDGFHYQSEYINSHTVDIGGVAVPMKDVKGCPETFDTAKLEAALKKLHTQNIVWPIYDRNIHDVIEDGVPITKDIVIIEGNWLALDEPPWTELARYCDDSVFMNVSTDILKERLIARKIKGGLLRADAEAFYERSDSKNIYRLSEHCQKVNIEI